MKLFIFEPYNWAYCGGAIGIIANTFEDAVDLIVREDRKRAIKEAKKNEWNRPKHMSPEEHVDMYKSYKSKKYFAKTTDNFKKDNYDQWLLTQIIEVKKEEKARVVSDNWNEA